MLDSRKNISAFSVGSGQYAAFRPTYPPELFSYLAEIAPARRSALDVGTGSGQAAVALADYFEQVIGIDSSAEQLAHAKRHPRVRYERIAAEEIAFPAESFDLVAVAQALHWFDLPTFFDKVNAQLTSRGVFAAWAYGFFSISTEIDDVVKESLLRPIDSFWAKANQIIIDRYTTIPFPFEEIVAPEFSMTVRWDLERLLGYVGTWSAVKRYEQETGRQVLPAFRQAVDEVWPKGESLPVRMDIATRVGRKLS